MIRTMFGGISSRTGSAGSFEDVGAHDTSASARRNAGIVRSRLRNGCSPADMFMAAITFFLWRGLQKSAPWKVTAILRAADPPERKRWTYWHRPELLSRLAVCAPER